LFGSLFSETTANASTLQTQIKLMGEALVDWTAVASKLGAISALLDIPIFVITYDENDYTAILSAGDDVLTPASVPTSELNWSADQMLPNYIPTVEVTLE